MCVVAKLLFITISTGEIYARTLVLIGVSKEVTNLFHFDPPANK